MKSRLAFFLSLSAALVAVTSAFAATLGDTARTLQISDWVKGKAVDLAAAKGKQVVVVEFWATWCGPCRTSIPHLTELQKKFKDVAFVGVSDEEVTTVKKFVDKMGDKMDYTVAVDKDRKTSADYMGAFGINGIPHAFIVDKEGRLIWHGHPMDNLEETLEEVIAGKFDLAKAKKRAEAARKLEAFYKAVSSGTTDAKLDEMGKELEALDTELGGIQPGEKFNAAETRKQINFQSLLREYQTAMMSGKDAANLAGLEKSLEENAPKDFDLTDLKANVAAGKLFNDYLRAATGQSDADALPDLTKKVAAAKANNPQMLLQVAWAILDDKQIRTRDYSLAAQLAKSAVDATDSKQPGPLYVYARALFDGGKTAEAVAAQKLAVVAVGDNEEARKQLEATLKQYEEKLAQK